MRTKKGIKELITGIMIGEGLLITDLEENAVDRIIEALTDENNLIIPDVGKSFTVAEIISELEDSDHLDDAIMFFKESEYCMFANVKI